MLLCIIHRYILGSHCLYIEMLNSKGKVNILLSFFLHLFSHYWNRLTILKVCILYCLTTECHKINFFKPCFAKKLICLMRSLKRSMKYIQKSLEFYAVMAESELSTYKIPLKKLVCLLNLTKNFSLVIVTEKTSI